ncbi:MAG: NAD(P)H-hydrate dehydratase [Burkholderiaceae bacterium]
MALLRILPSREAHPLHGIERSRAHERQAQAALPEHTLMQRAGLATARLAMAIAPHAQRVWIAAGPGNNGGDGLEAAMHLAQRGLSVTLSLLADPARLPDDAARSRARAGAAGVAIDAALPAADALHGFDLVIDALFGIGVSRAPEGVLAAAIELLNCCLGPRLAIDLPSGLHAQTGQPLGATTVRATHTLSLLTLKPGLFTGAARDCVGEVWFDGLDVPFPPGADAWLAGAPHPLERGHDRHKGSFGDLAIVAGAAGMAGAALLAARAGLAAGAGRVFVQALGTSALELDPLHPELMFRSGLLDDRAQALRLASIACGCGGGSAVHAILPQVLALPARLVLDADALNAIAADSALQVLLAARAARGHATVLTPHPLEAARLLGITTREVQADRLLAASRIAERWRCTVLLKGSGSIVAAPGRVPSINPTGNAALASAGTGDVLAGWLAGSWSGRATSDGFDVAVEAAWLHGAAAPASPVAPLRASDVIESMLAQRVAARSLQPR